MTETAWKKAERRAAALIGGLRYWANSGEAVDVESARMLMQVKHVQTCSLAQLEGLALTAEIQGAQKGKLGMVWVKRRGGQGAATTPLIVMTEAAFKSMGAAAASESSPE